MRSTQLQDRQTDRRVGGAVRHMWGEDVRLSASLSVCLPHSAVLLLNSFVLGGFSLHQLPPHCETVCMCVW